MKHNLIKTLSATVLILSGMIAAALLLGFRPCILESASMEPTYKRGAFVLVNTNVRSSNLEIGDVVVYRTSTGAQVMHRLVGENTLQGDANSISQHVELNDANLVGRATLAFYLPGIGKMLNIFLSHPWIIWLIAGVLLLLACRPQLKTMDRKTQS